ncbi:MAG: ScyD/ScyE family protein [Nocardioides sp.]
MTSTNHRTNHRTNKRVITAVGTALALAALGASPTYAGQSRHHDGDHHHGLTQVAPLNGPRGVDALGHGLTLVTESDGGFSLVVERPHHAAHVVRLGSLGGDFPPAIAMGRHGTVWLLTGGGPPPGEAATPRTDPARALVARGSAASDPTAPAAPATLFRWHRGMAAPVPVADIAAYQVTDPDPYNQADPPEESNPFGLAALPQGGVLVADAAANDLLRVRADGTVSTVARLKPRLVEVPAGLPDVPPDQGGPLPPAGTPIMSEAVATSVTIGGDGAWYVGELRGFPATPGTSEIWRVPAGTTGATCDPEHPWQGRCHRFADGLTSIVDLAPAPHGVLAVSLSRMSWLQLELGVPGSEIGGLFSVTRTEHHAAHVRELVPGRLTLPAGVDSTRDGVYVTGPLFGPGFLWKLH